VTLPIWLGPAERHKKFCDQQLLNTRTSIPVATIAANSLKPGETIHIIENVLYPESEYKRRMAIGKDAQFGDGSSIATVVDASSHFKVWIPY